VGVAAAADEWRAVQRRHVDGIHNDLSSFGIEGSRIIWPQLTQLFVRDRAILTTLNVTVRMVHEEKAIAIADQSLEPLRPRSCSKDESKLR